jgi:hypothetical protein
MVFNQNFQSHLDFLTTVVENAEFLSRKPVSYGSVARDGTQGKVQSPQNCFGSEQFMYLPTLMLITTPVLKNVVLLKILLYEFRCQIN